MLFVLAFAAALMLAASFALSLAVSLLKALWPSAGGTLVAAALAEVLIYALFALWLTTLPSVAPGAAGAAAGPRAVNVLALRRASWVLLLCGATLGFALHGPADCLEALVERWAPLSHSMLIERAARLLPESTLEKTASFALVAGCVPLVEEMFFRGALFSLLLRQLSLRSAVVLSSVCFAVSHAEARYWPALLGVGLCLGALRALGGSILPCVLLHAAFNATTLGVLYSHPTAAFEASAPSFGLAVSGALVSSLLLFLAANEGRRAGAFE